MRTSFNEYYDLRETNGDNPERAAREAEKLKKAQDASNLEYECRQVATDFMDEILVPARNFMKKYGVPPSVVDMTFRDMDLIKKMGATLAEYARKTGKAVRIEEEPSELTPIPPSL